VGTVWFNEDDNGRQQATTLGRDDITADDVMGAMHYRRLNRRL